MTLEHGDFNKRNDEGVVGVVVKPVFTLLTSIVIKFSPEYREAVMDLSAESASRYGSMDPWARRVFWLLPKKDRLRANARIDSALEERRTPNG